MNARHALALSLGLVVTGCYLSHERPGPARLDAALPLVRDAAIPIAPSVRDAAAPADSTCAPMRARIEPCVGECDNVTGAFWDGQRCAPVSCNCNGPDCGTFTSVPACQRAYAACPGERCRAAGGTWHPELEYCGHFVCGRPAPDSCETGTAACDCGPGRTYDDTRGCVAVPCPRSELAPETLCGATSGRWDSSLCGSTECGRASPDPCASGGCRCADDEVFDDVVGCRHASECLVRRLGEVCTGSRLRLRCADGLVCRDTVCSRPVCEG